jgi:hypothetical protein
MTPSWGVFLFWTATIIAGLIVVWELWGYVYDAERGEPIIWIAPLLFAAAIWLVGWACRYLLATLNNHRLASVDLSEWL